VFLFCRKETHGSQAAIDDGVGAVDLLAYLMGRQACFVQFSDAVVLFGR